MNRKLSHRTYLILTVAGIVFLYVFAWYGTIRSTVQKVRLVSEVVERKAQTSQLYNDYIAYNNTLEGKELAMHSASNDSIKEIFFNKISDVCLNYKQLKLVAFPELHTYSSKNYKVLTNTVEFEGDFFEMLDLIYELENKNELGVVIINSTFQNRMNYKTKREELYLKLLLQKYIPI